MSVKDRLDRLEARIGEPNFELPLAPHSEMIHDLRVGMRNAGASLDGLYDRIESNNKFIVSVSSITADLSDGIEELNSDINTLKEALPDVEDKIKYMSHQIEDLQKILCKCKSTPAATKPEKFIKVKNTHCDIYLLRFNDLAIKSSWDEEEDQQIPGEIIFNPLGIVKSYSDKEAWQHDLNKIEWFIYDDALLLDLTDLVAPDMGVHWKPPSNHHDICPICKERLVYYAKEDTYNCYIPTTGMGTIAGRMCTQCNYKES